MHVIRKFIHAYTITVYIWKRRNLLCGDADLIIAAGCPIQENGHCGWWGLPAVNSRGTEGCNGCGTSTVCAPPGLALSLPSISSSVSSSTVISSSSSSSSKRCWCSSSDVVLSFDDNKLSTLNEIFVLYVGSDLIVSSMVVTVLIRRATTLRRIFCLFERGVGFFCEVLWNSCRDRLKSRSVHVGNMGPCYWRRGGLRADTPTFYCWNIGVALMICARFSLTDALHVIFRYLSYLFRNYYRCYVGLDSPLSLGSLKSKDVARMTWHILQWKML